MKGKRTDSLRQALVGEASSTTENAVKYLEGARRTHCQPITTSLQEIFFVRNRKAAKLGWISAVFPIIRGIKTL
jgi:hypothetical protein